MIQNEIKKKLGLFVLKYIKPDTIIGIGTGSTTSYFIDALKFIKNKIKGAVSSSVRTSEKLKKIGIKLFNLNDVNHLDIYIDSADEINNNLEMIKGGGAALTREKIIATAAKKFICIVDENKLVNILGKFPLPIEVMKIARSLVSREIVRLGGLPIYRQGVVTDNGNIILDIHNLVILNPLMMEKEMNSIPGIITVGLFAKRRADIALIGNSQGVKIIK